MEFVSADEAWNEFKAEYFAGKEELAQGFEQDNPLAGSASWNILINDIQQQEGLVSWLKEQPGVRAVNYSSSAVSSLIRLNRVITLLSGGIILILLLVAVFLISNTIAVGITVRSEERKRELLQIIKNGDEKESKKARDEMINGNLRLVLSVIHRFRNRGEELDDLFQVGVIGLIKAINNFDPALEVKFSTYGVPMILGELKRYIRDNNSVRVSRSMRDTAYRAMQLKEQLTVENNREPTVEEIAAQMKLPKEDVVLALEAIVEPVSLYEPVYSDGTDTVYVMDQIGDKSDDATWLEELAIKDAIRGLSDREKKILGLRFFKGKTQMEVAEEIGISQAQVSRIEKGALNTIKKNI